MDLSYRVAGRSGYPAVAAVKLECFDLHQQLMLGIPNCDVAFADTVYIPEAFLYSDTPVSSVLIGCFHPASFVFEQDSVEACRVGRRSQTFSQFSKVSDKR